MKKYFLLTSVLALAACGGGSGGGGVDIAPVTRAAMTSDSAAATSNAAITSMASEILVKDGSAIAPAARAGTTVYHGQTYKSYRLDDVDFRMAGDDSKIVFGLDNEGRIVSAGRYEKNNSGRYELSKEGKFTRSSTTSKDFGGAKTMYAWETEFSNTGLQTALTAALNNLTEAQKDGMPTVENLANWISGQFDDAIVVQSDNRNVNVGSALQSEINKEVDKWAESQYSHDSEWEGTPWMTTVIAAAKAYYNSQIPSTFGTPTEYINKLNIMGADIGLKYADLGFADLQVAEKANPTHVVEHTFTPYVGGYSVLERNVAVNTEFTGTAVAGVEHTDENGEKDAVLVRQDNAKLTLNADGSSVLEMKNLVRVDESDGKTPVTGEGAGHWYELTVERGAGQNGTPTFTVSGNNTIDGYNLPTGLPSEAIAFAANEYNATEGEYVRTDTVNDVRYGGSVTNQAYGTSADDIEATSTFGFSNEKPSTHEEVAIYGAFGGTPTPAE